MRPLISFEQYDRLGHLRDRMEHSEPGNAQVFVPVGPDPGSDCPGILFIGQATKDWTKRAVSNYQGAVKEGIALAHCCADRNGPFFQVVDEIVWAVCGQLDLEPAGGQGDLVGWSNLAKIGRIHGNPAPTLIALQQDLCIGTLRHELETMQPAAVVLLTRNFAQHEILEPVFGRDGWTQDLPSEDRVAHKTLAGRPIVWMNHPRNPGPAGYRRASVELAVCLICRRL